MFRSKHLYRPLTVFGALALVSCQDEAGQPDPDGNSRTPVAAEAPADYVDALPGTPVTGSQLAEPLGTMTKGEFETSEEHRKRLTLLDRKFRSRGLIKTETPADYFRWDYDADTRNLTYNLEAVASLNAYSALIYAGIDKPILWPVAEEVGQTDDTKLYLSTRPCQLRLKVSPDLARNLKEPRNGSRLILLYKIPSYSDSVLNKANKEINFSWKDNYWNEVLLKADLQEVRVVSGANTELSATKCRR